MQHRQQTKRTNCGQTCIQMITGNLDIQTIEGIVGKKGLTRGKDLIQALEKLGYRTTPKFNRMPSELLKSLSDTQFCHQTYLCMVRPKTYKKHKGHWVLISEKYVYDPGYNNKIRIRSYLKNLEKQDRKITSYVVVTN